VKGAFGLSVGLVLALGVRTAVAQSAAAAPKAPPPAATPDATPPPAADSPPANGSSAAATPSGPAPAPPTAPATITVGMPQPVVRPISPTLGVGVALTYVSIPLIFVSGAVLGVGYLVDSDGAKVTGWVMTGTSLALFGVGVGFLVSGSQQGPQPQKSASTGRPARFEMPERVKAREASIGMTVPVLSGAF
jgi:hypothetical protein